VIVAFLLSCVPVLFIVHANRRALRAVDAAYERAVKELNG
jgi:hypothetical protein